MVYEIYFIFMFLILFVIKTRLVSQAINKNVKNKEKIHINLKLVNGFNTNTPQGEISQRRHANKSAIVRRDGDGGGAGAKL